MMHRATDCFGRIVFFQLRERKREADTFVAKNARGEESYYRVRHRIDGPAIIDKKGVRRWFIYGQEVTKKVEGLISENSDCFIKDNDDFELKKEWVLLLELNFSELQRKPDS
jgi:16S rRNA C1402 (ribose-2'-O) methylase RsmI